MRCYIILLVGSNAAPCVHKVQVRALLLHFPDELFVHFYILKHRCLLLTLFQALALVEIKPGILLNLFQAVAQCWLRHENVFYQVAYFL